jgi:protocatechuate 3,4-dioxygenase beta subunit
MMTAVLAAAFVFGLVQAAPVAGTRTSSVVVPPEGEPGDPLIVEGRVLTASGAPAGGLDVYVYQTDARGYYSPNGRDERNPRLRGYLRTDGEGRYQVRTIRPGPYPNSGPPAHIHYEVTSATGVQQFELVFEGDARMTEAIRRDAAAHGAYTLCKPVAGAGGAQTCKGADLYLK